MEHSVAVVAALGALVASTVAYGFDESTGAIDGCASADGRPIAAKVETLYHVMLRSGRDIDAREDEDVVVRKTEGEGWIGYKCTNPKLPGIEIVKRYRKALGGIRRTLAFRNLNAESCYVTPFVECHFDAGFQDGAWFLGAGYIGPYKPFPKVAAPRIVNEHVQSSKGLAFVHPKSDRGGFAHYRTKIDDTVVFPWWHSSIGRYRELHDRLWYLPDGYRMGLGTFGLYEGKVVSVTDQFSAFEGDMFAFFDDVFAKDPDFSRELKSIPAPSPWLDDCFACVDVSTDGDKLRWIREMTDDCETFGWFGCVPSSCYSWGDYRADRDFPTYGGGRCTGAEYAAGISALKRRAPGAHLGTYSIVIATAWFTDVLKEHPTWYRRTDRSGSPDSLFPRMQNNWQTMFCYPECRDWLVDMLVKWTDDIGTDVLYLDENQMTNTIDWERDRVTRDDDTARFWQTLSKRLKEKGKTYFANGSGVPYPDVNFMESPDELQPRLWRDWVGIGWGIGMMCRLRPGQRVMPLYWDGEGKCDYANRILALGWLPHTYLLHPKNDFVVMRAAYQSGNMLPANVKYSPDWRTDETIDVEGHAVRREKARDVVLSFINRAAEAKDVPVGIDLGTLGFAADERISIWRQHLDFNRAGTRRDAFPSDAEARTNWREKGVVQGMRLTDPELVYSGKADGTFKHVLRQLEPNGMDQFVVTAAPLSFFAVDDKPLNGFYTTQKRGRIDGHKVSLERRADVLFAGRGSVFSSVTANGRPVRGRFVNLKDGIGALVTLEPGEWTLDWTESPVDAQNPPKAELPVVPTEPFRSSVRLPNGGYSDRVEELKDVGLDKDGARVLRSGLYVKSNSTGMVFQTSIPFCAAKVDPGKLAITAGLTRREIDAWTFDNFAGFELEGAKSFRARFSHTFAKAISHDFGHTLSNEKSRHFCGFTVDYRAGGKYVRRIAVSTGAFSRENEIENPPWGTKRKPDELYYAGEWVEEKSGRVFSFDLAKFAPEGWDGVAFVSVGTSRIKPGHAIALEFLSFNKADAGDFVTPVSKNDARKCPPPLRSKRLTKRPKSLEKIDAKEWRNWALAAPFVRNKSGAVLAQSRAYFAHDNEYVYVGFEADEPTRPPICGKDYPYQHEHVELFLKNPGGVLHQIIADPVGRVLYYPDRHGTPVPKGFVVTGEVVPDMGWRVFFALPISDLRFNTQFSPVTLSAEVCRDRLSPNEDSAWTPIDGFFDYAGYGTLILDFK